MRDVVFLRAIVAEFPLQDVNGGEGDTEDDEGSKIEGEVCKVAGVSVDDAYVISRAVNELLNHDVVADVGGEPDEDEVRSEDLVVAFSLGLIILIVGESFLSS